MDDTVAAIATAHGVASIAIVRVSGSKALHVAQRLTHDKPLTPRYAHLASLYDRSGALIDKALVIYFRAPYSFTGEDIVEFQCHGGLVVAQRVLDTLLAYGVRLAAPGEFSKRAFLNDKIDLTEAEAIAKLIEAKSEEAAKVLARQLSGELKAFVERCRDEITRMLAHVEVAIDYAEEDLPQDLKASIEKELVRMQRRLDLLVEQSKRRKGLIEGFKVAIVGKPNVGKSSLLNALLSQERAIVSDVAGTTRDTIEEQIRIGTHLVRLVDTAGIRETSDAVEQIGIARSLASIEQADVIIALFDRSRPFDEEDAYVVRRLRDASDAGKTVIAALNKCDLPDRFDTAALSGFETVEVSVLQGFETLLEHIRNHLDAAAQGEELMLVSSRQIDAVERASQALNEATLPLQNGALEFFAYHAQEALRALGSISRPYDNEAVLDAMFGEFCLGK